MTTMTLRGIDDTIAAVLKDRHDKRSQRQCRDAQILKESFGIEKKKRSTVYNDLDHLAGTWSAQENDDILALRQYLKRWVRIYQYVEEPKTSQRR